MSNPERSVDRRTRHVAVFAGGMFPGVTLQTLMIDVGFPLLLAWVAGIVLSALAFVWIDQAITTR